MEPCREPHSQPTARIAGRGQPVVDFMNPNNATVAFGAQDLLDSLKESALLSVEEIERVSQRFVQSNPDAPTLAKWLLDEGLVTNYQLDALTKRDFSKLRIGNYDVLDRIGAGGMGAVFKARHRRMKRVVALKLLTMTASKDDTYIRRFQREVEAIARLSHPNIVMAYDADEADVGHFLVMEFVNGRDLASEVGKNGPLPVGTTVDCILQAARALDYAHGQGIVHRDIKPANFLRDTDGAVKVADLGLARFNDQFEQSHKEASALTQAGTIMGTVDFMSPEQAMGQSDIDRRTDIYSLGCTLYFLLTGQPPYQGATLMATLLQHREGTIPSLSQARPDVPPPLDAAFRRMVAKAPADRYQSMADVIAALESIAASIGGGESTQPAAQTGPPTAGGTGFWQNPTVAAVSPAGSATTIDVQPSELAGTRSKTVLLVEPSRTQSGIIRKYLQSNGVDNVVTASSGREALNAARIALPDAIVCALHLPDMTGIELAQQIRGDGQSTTPGFVLISSQAESAGAGSLSHCGRALMLLKPFTPEQLIDSLKLVTAEPPANRRRDELRVLIVDDSAAARMHVRSVLQQMGFSQFVEAGDGAHAIAAVASDRFDFIVTDYNMPLMDGRGFVAYLRQNPETAATPIIMVTTETDSGKLEAVRQMNVTICEKSFPRPAVETFLREVVGVV